MTTVTRDFRGTLAVRGVEIHVDVRAAGDGPPLLLCNGIGANLGARIYGGGFGDDPDMVAARLMAALMRDCTVHIVRGGGHLALLTHVNELVPVVHRFLS